MYKKFSIKNINLSAVHRTSKIRRVSKIFVDPFWSETVKKTNVTFFFLLSVFKFKKNKLGREKENNSDLKKT